MSAASTPASAAISRRVRTSTGSKFAMWRVAESATAMLAFTGCAPLIALAAVVIRVSSGRCPFVAHRRVGLNGREFWMLKLRTMWCGHDRPSDATLIEYLDPHPMPTLKHPEDPRVTSQFAALLRKYSVDELPQLLHVISGKMSFVGPRPLTRFELITYYGHDSLEVLQKRPGLTGLWQVTGRSRLTYAQRKRLDLALVRNWSLRLCLKILLRTPHRIVNGRDAY